MTFEFMGMICRIANSNGIGISACNWVKSQLIKVDPNLISIDRQSREFGYRCLGYQSDLIGLGRKK
jgi:hypothetical protein